MASLMAVSWGFFDLRAITSSLKIIEDVDVVKVCARLTSQSNIATHFDGRLLILNVLETGNVGRSNKALILSSNC